MRYYFQICNHDTYSDKIGQSFPNAEGVKAHAARLAKEIAGDEDWDNHWVVVTDEDEKEVVRVPISAAQH
jgi:hypothetical protein